jgi:hypothetical protein
MTERYSVMKRTLYSTYFVSYDVDDDDKLQVDDDQL